MKWLFIVTFAALASCVLAGGDPGLEINIRTLEAQIQAQITQLNATGYGNLCLNLQNYEQALQALLQRAQTTDDQGMLDLLRREYSNIKSNADQEMNNLKRDLQTIQDLTLKAATLKARVAADLATLKLYNMTSHIEILQIDEERIEMLLGHLKNVTQVATVRHLEEAIKEVENHINQDLDRAEQDLRNIHSFYGQTRAGGLLYTIGDAGLLTRILALKGVIGASSKASESQRQRYLLQVNRLAKQCEATLDSRVHRVLMIQYMMLKYEIARNTQPGLSGLPLLQVSNTADDVRDFATQVDTEIKQLESSGHKQLTSNLVKIRSQADELRKVLSQLNATSADYAKQLQVLGTELSKLRKDFADEVKALQSDVPAVDVLRARARNLLFAIKTDIELLQQRNMTDMAAKLQIDADRLATLNKDLEEEHNVEGVRYLETLLRGIETDITAKLQKMEEDLMKPETALTGDDGQPEPLTLEVNLDDVNY